MVWNNNASKGFEAKFPKYFPASAAVSNWVIDARIYQPDEDGKKKYEHLQDMMLKAIERGVIFKTVLMDTNTKI